jgi:hypothetical protein
MASMIEYINGHFVWCKQTTEGMGKVYADIQLLNAEDVALSRKHMLGEDEIRRFNKRMLVDTGSLYLCINENIQQVLQVPALGMKKMVVNPSYPDYPYLRL